MLHVLCNLKIMHSSSFHNKGLDITGIFGSVCKHEVPGRFMNMKHGERFGCEILPLYIFPFLLIYKHVYAKLMDLLSIHSIYLMICRLWMITCSLPDFIHCTAVALEYNKNLQ